MVTGQIGQPGVRVWQSRVREREGYKLERVLALTHSLDSAVRCAQEIVLK